jgi:hypothetical protein
MELRFNVGVSLSFGLGRWETTAPFRKDCGMNMAGILVNTFGDNSKGRLGPLVCRDSFDFDLQPLNPVKPTLSHDDGRMRFSAAQVAPDEVKRGEQVKNLSLGLAITLSFSAGALLLYTAWKASLRPQSSPCDSPPSPSRQPPVVDFFSPGVEAGLLQGGSPTMLEFATPSKEPMKGRNLPYTGSRRVDQAGLFDRACSFDGERTYPLSRSPSISSAQSLCSVPQRESTVASFLDQQQQEQQQRQQQQQQQQSGKAPRSPRVASRRSQSDHPSQFGNQLQPSCDSPGRGGSSRDSQASLGTQSASAEAGNSGEGDRVGVDAALSDESMTVVHVGVQEDERNDQAQAQHDRMP